MANGDELRGLLGAYKAKAARLGAAEDPGLAERYDQARDLLWTAPCDLAAAAAAVAGLPASRAGGAAAVTRAQPGRRIELANMASTIRPQTLT